MLSAVLPGLFPQSYSSIFSVEFLIFAIRNFQKVFFSLSVFFLLASYSYFVDTVSSLISENINA